MIKLVEPSLEYKEQIWDFRKEVFEKEPNEDRFAGCYGLNICDSPEEWIDFCEMRNDSELCKCLVHDVLSKTFLVIRETDNRLVGIIDLRYESCNPIVEEWGHCGYSVRPSEQRKGYGTEMLRLNLEKAKEVGLQEMIIVCDVTNIASEKVILANGGILQESKDETERRYKIYIN